MDDNELRKHLNTRKKAVKSAQLVSDVFRKPKTGPHLVKALRACVHGELVVKFLKGHTHIGKNLLTAKQNGRSLSPVVCRDKLRARKALPYVNILIFLVQRWAPFAYRRGPLDLAIAALTLYFGDQDQVSARS